MIYLKSVKRICKDYMNVENYTEAINDENNTWVLHHRREVQDGFNIWSRNELIKIGQYYNVPANDVIFLRKDVHRRLHNLAINVKTGEFSCARHLTGEKNGMFGKHATGPNKGFKHVKKRERSVFVKTYGYTKRELANFLNIPEGSISYFHKTGKLLKLMNMPGAGKTSIYSQRAEEI